jgi:hypothetical protein
MVSAQQWLWEFFIVIRIKRAEQRALDPLPELLLRRDIIVAFFVILDHFIFELLVLRKRW